MNKLLPCPFCGSHDVDEEFWVSTYEESGPGCDNCGATARTVESWNTRHAPEGWQLVYDALDKVKDMVPDDEVYEQCVDALSAAPKWGGE